jgi:sterol desaturase/sphingolipid hydroxylase (fatty acid hydroxylase superfamily)/CDGSH-type Zn-finger protein
MKNGVGIDVYLVIGILMFFALMEIIVGHLKQSKRTKGDWFQEAGGFFALSLLIKPLIVLSVIFIGHTFFPQYQHLLSNWSLWVLLPLYVLIDDLLQYWYHRSGHEYEFLWKLHRSHHQAEQMGFFISYRNAGLYYLMMPNLWWLATITFLGGGYAVAIGLVLKQLVIIGSHSTISWDKPLYKNKITAALMSVIERIIVTPAFHHGHHGQSKKDGISEPNGNFGNMFSIWDQLFGSAVFSRQFPTDYGLQVATDEHWTASYFYPLIKSKDKDNIMSKGFLKIKTSTLEPIVVELIKGEKYLWCQCGKSKTQPFCDGSHHGSKIGPVLFVAQKDGKARLCNCKASKNSPFCDGSHIDLKKQHES